MKDAMHKLMFWRLALVTGLVLLLEILCIQGWIKPQVLVAPDVMVRTLWHLLRQGVLIADLQSTLGSVLQALLLAIGLGTFGGWLMYRFARLRAVLQPLVSSWYAVPVFAFYPVLIAFLGLNQRPVVAIGVLFAVVAVMVNTLNGLDQLPRILLQSAQLMGLSHSGRIFRVMLPAALPALMTGFKLAATYAFIGVIAAEFILSTQGLGHAIAYAYNDFDTRTMYALMLLVLLLSGAVQLTLLRIERRLMLHRSTLGSQ